MFVVQEAILQERLRRLMHCRLLDFVADFAAVADHPYVVAVDFAVDFAVAAVLPVADFAVDADISFFLCDYVLIGDDGAFIYYIAILVNSNT
jgi:hypothetical protein